MQPKYERGTLRLSAVFLLAAALLIALGFAGMGASLPVVAGMGVLAVVLFVAWQNADEAEQYLSGMWLGPTIGAVAAFYAVTIGASAGELQAIGGVVGLVGVLNLLLRPVYRLIYYVVSGAQDIQQEMREERS